MASPSTRSLASREETHRRYAFRDGGFVDAYSMARLKG